MFRQLEGITNPVKYPRPSFWWTWFVYWIFNVHQQLQLRLLLPSFRELDPSQKCFHFQFSFFVSCSFSSSGFCPPSFREPDPNQKCLHFCLTFSLKVCIFSSGCLPPFPAAGPEPEILTFPFNFLFKSAHFQLRLPFLPFRQPNPSQKCLHLL